MDTSVFFTYPGVQTQPTEATAGFLDGASETEWDTLLSYADTRHLRRGETVFTEGDLDRASSGGAPSAVQKRKIVQGRWGVNGGGRHSLRALLQPPDCHQVQRTV